MKTGTTIIALCMASMACKNAFAFRTTKIMGGEESDLRDFPYFGRSPFVLVAAFVVRIFPLKNTSQSGNLILHPVLCVPTNGTNGQLIPISILTEKTNSGHGSVRGNLDWS